jgi:hypothetical protein
MNELRMKIGNNKEEVTHGMENLRKNNETEVKNKMEDHSGRLEQAEDRTSELEDEMEIKGKIEEILDNSRPLKEYARTHQLHQKTKPENHGH